MRAARVLTALCLSALLVPAVLAVAENDCGTGADSTYEAPIPLSSACDGHLSTGDGDHYVISIMEGQLLRVRLSASEDAWACVGLPVPFGEEGYAPCITGPEATDHQVARASGMARIWIFKPLAPGTTQDITYRVEAAVKDEVGRVSAIAATGHGAPSVSQAVRAASGIDGAWMTLPRIAEDDDVLMVSAQASSWGGGFTFRIFAENKEVGACASPAWVVGCPAPAGATHAFAQHDAAVLPRYTLVQYG